MKWITRAHVRVDRVACPWLIKKFIDPEAEFEFREPSETSFASIPETEGITFDAYGAKYDHRGPLCTFEVLLDAYGLTDPALRRMGRIIRSADVAEKDPTPVPEGAGLRAVALGFSKLFANDDLENNLRQWVVYDALYAYCQG